jgi:hypothetical protein
VVCGSPAYFAAHGTPKSPADLGTHACVTFEGLMSPDAWIFTAGKSDTSVAIHSRLVVNTAEAAIDAAIAGIGVTRVLSYQIASAARAGALTFVLQEYEPEPSPVSLVYGGRLLPLKLRARGTAVEGAAFGERGVVGSLEEHPSTCGATRPTIRGDSEQWRGSRLSALSPPAPARQSAPENSSPGPRENISKCPAKPR